MCVRILVILLLMVCSCDCNMSTPEPGPIGTFPVDTDQQKIIKTAYDAASKARLRYKDLDIPSDSSTRERCLLAAKQLYNVTHKYRKHESEFNKTLVLHAYSHLIQNCHTDLPGSED